MTNEMRFDGRVVIVTGAGGGLGRSHALLFAKRGAKVLVNDLGGSPTGQGSSLSAADHVVKEITEAGGIAAANYDSVEEGAKIVQAALDRWGGVDVLVNNAGILRDTTFLKMTSDDWDLVYRVHVLGAFRLTHAVWPAMRDKRYGRILFTASAAGLYGNFGQANYAMAKLGLVGFAKTLALEGKKRNILVNTIAPLAGSRLTETILPPEIVQALKPEYVSPLVAKLCHESSEETGGVYEVGGGFVAKLRWERAQGHTFRLGRVVTPEAIEEHWAKIASFDESTHPAGVEEAMAPILSNLQAGPSRGANAFIDVDLALGHEFAPANSRYDERDLVLYALAVGAGKDPLDSHDLRFVYELHGDGFLPLPTFAVVPPLRIMMERAREGETAPGLRYGFDRILHGEQRLELRRPLPPRSELTHRAKIKNIWDKGRHATVVTSVTTVDESGEVLFENQFTTLVRGGGGFGGERGPTGEENAPPTRAPDHVVNEKIPDNQALLYRLTGDWNPLHADPSFASAFGFSRPILHGLCTLGWAARQVIRQFSPKGDPRFFKSIQVRFAEPVFPGETLKTEMWKEGEGRIVFRTSVVEREKVVLANAALEFFASIPEAPKPNPRDTSTSRGEKPPATEKAPSAGAGTGAITSAQVFEVLSLFLADNPNLKSEVQTSFQFVLKSPESAWLLDLRDRGTVVEGRAPKADVTLELSDADFVGMTAGSLDPQKLYFEGRLKITGNLMASQKLFFLKKVDVSRYVNELAGKGKPTPVDGGARAEAKPQDGMNERGAPLGESSSGATSEPIAPRVRAAIESQRAARDLFPKVNGLVELVILPDIRWTIDGRAHPARFAAEPARGATTVVTVGDADLADLVFGRDSLASLFQKGKLVVFGDVRQAQGLEPLTRLLA